MATDIGWILSEGRSGNRSATANADTLIRRFMVRFALVDRVRSQFKRHRYLLLFLCKTAHSTTSLLSRL